MRYDLTQIAAICGGRFTGSDRATDSVTTDSRSFFGRGISPLFVAIGGRNHDGHAHINEMYSRGVRGFMIEKDVATDKYPDAGFVLVESSVRALQALAADYRGRVRGTVVGITGSNGKTIVKEWIASLAPAGVKLFRSPRSFNSQIGVALSILMMDGNEDVAVIEAGISQPGEMRWLERMVKPDIAVITTIGDAHQENFGSWDAKVEEKLVLAKDAKHIVFNGAYESVRQRIAELYPNTPATDSAMQTAAYGFFDEQTSRENAAAAVTVWDVLGYDHAATVSHLCDLHSIAMRLELKEGISNSLIINDSYNSDINSLGIALDYLRGVAGDKPRMVVLSDILQSGMPQRELYAKVAQMVGDAGISDFVGIGRQIGGHADLFGPGSAFYAGTEEFLADIRSRQIAGRAILIKGNRSSRFELIVHALGLRSHTTTLEVDLDAMIYNLEAHRALLRPQTKIMAMVKAGGYGNGNYEVANMLQGKGVDFLAVAYADEGVRLRRLGIAMPIVVLNADSDSFDLMISHSLEPEIYSMLSLRHFADAVKRHGERSYPIHIKADTGMHRLGFEPHEAAALGEELDRLSGYLRVSSAFSHLAAADDPAQDEFTARQIGTFARFCDTLEAALGYAPLRHIANSAAIERLPGAQFDMVRLGIGLYGVGSTDGVPLRPVSTLRTRIVQVKTIGTDDSVGYGREGRVGRLSQVATIPVGYADGLDRKLGSGKWAMLVGGKPALIVGRVCMDTCMIDVTGTDAYEGQEVVIFGPQEGYTVEDMARALGTIPYEIMTSVSDRVKRIFSKE